MTSSTVPIPGLISQWTTLKRRRNRIISYTYPLENREQVKKINLCELKNIFLKTKQSSDSLQNYTHRNVLPSTFTKNKTFYKKNNSISSQRDKYTEQHHIFQNKLLRKLIPEPIKVCNTITITEDVNQLVKSETIFNSLHLRIKRLSNKSRKDTKLRRYF